MDFVLALHSHLPWVLHHGRWPHGSDWLCEAAVDSYLPLLGTLEALEQRGVSAPLTVGVTPILANQLAHPSFRTELDAFLDQRIEACEEAMAAFAGSAEAHLRPTAIFWRMHLRRLRRTFERADRDVVGALRGHADRGRIEIMSSAATHGFLPLLARDESIRFQLEVGRGEHERLFGRQPVGLWLPECGYRGAGPWAPWPGAPAADHREGLETFVEQARYRYFFTDAHMAEAGESLSLYGEHDVVDGIRAPDAVPMDRVYPRSPYQTYRIGASPRGPAAFVRDPQTSLRVWSRHQGYPGDGAYLEFHKIRFPGGLKFWRVTGTGVDLGDKLPYDVNVARARAYGHGRDLAATVTRLVEAGQPAGGTVVAVPFDTELFGHWWFEGVDFLADLYRALARQGSVRPTSASGHLAKAPPRHAIRLADGSWGANGDASMWLGPATAWTWERLWALETRFWDLVPSVRAVPAAEPVLEQAARELLLAQSSDWQFIISTGAAADYAERRFAGHCDALEDLLTRLADGTAASGAATARAEELRQLDDPFPSLLPALDRALAGTPHG